MYKTIRRVGLPEIKYIFLNIKLFHKGVNFNVSSINDFPQSLNRYYGTSKKLLFSAILQSWLDLVTFFIPAIDTSQALLSQTGS